jgi:zinc finger protein
VPVECAGCTRTSIFDHIDREIPSESGLPLIWLFQQQQQNNNSNNNMTSTNPDLEPNTRPNKDNNNDNDHKKEEDDDDEQNNAANSNSPLVPSSLDDWQEAHENDMSTIYNCYCPNCGGGTATTTLLPTKVPMFREIIVMTLVCPECYFRNSEVTFGGTIQDRGERITLHVLTLDDLNRQVIKSDSATLTIPQLELEIPPGTQQGTVTTLEGMLKRAAHALQEGQAQRLALGDVDNFRRCQHVIDQLLVYANGGDESSDDHVFPEFDIILDDPAGNSFIENLQAPHADPAMTHTRYHRTARQDMALGLQPSAQAIAAGTIDDANPLHKNMLNDGVSTTIDETTRVLQKMKIKKQQQMSVTEQGASTNEPVNEEQEKDEEQVNDDDDDDDVGRQEVIKFQTPCPHCFVTAETDMCVTDIPHFKEVIIMSLFCQACGYKSNEIKGGGAIPKFGCRITVTVQDDNDMAREVLKSDTAGIQIPELELELEEGGLDGMYTTIEGLMKKLYDRLKAANPFGAGDAATKQHLNNDTANTFSAPSPNHARYLKFLQRLDQMAQGQSFPFTLIVSDPLANSFVGPVPQDAVALALQAEREGSNECYNTYVDHGTVLEEYERTMDQNEVLGLNDMKTENYMEESKTSDAQQDGQGRAAAASDEQATGDKVKAPYYGTDQPEEVPDRIRRVDVRGPDHPHSVGKAPVEGDTTVMGAGSLNFAVPSIAQRGTKAVAISSTTSSSSLQSEQVQPTTGTTDVSDDGSQLLRKLIHDFEYNDNSFRMNDAYEGSIEGMVYKDGAQGLGYYTNVSLLQLYEEYQRVHNNS